MAMTASSPAHSSDCNCHVHWQFYKLKYQWNQSYSNPNHSIHHHLNYSDSIHPLNTMPNQWLNEYVCKMDISLNKPHLYGICLSLHSILQNL